MSKLKRSTLKSVVKECLLEILSEGINTQAPQNIQPMGNMAKQQDLKVPAPVHDNDDIMQGAIAEITSDPILAAVLQDTARTTLVEQAGADRSNQIRQMRSSGASHNSHEQEPDGDSHWAALAFADNKN